MDVTHELVKGDYTAGNPIVLQVALSRDADEEDEDDQRVEDPTGPDADGARQLLETLRGARTDAS